MPKATENKFPSNVNIITHGFDDTNRFVFTLNDPRYREGFATADDIKIEEAKLSSDDLTPLFIETLSPFAASDISMAKHPYIDEYGNVQNGKAPQREKFNSVRRADYIARNRTYTKT